jgi:Trk-type K+ transport system membrane component
MSIRSTNVYEERSLGVFEHDETPADEPTLVGDKSEVFRYVLYHLPSTIYCRLTISKYLAWHLRRQLAFDIWPLCLAIFAITIFERGKIMDPEKSEWFTIFKIIFECTSAYSTIGLSLGTPNNNWSFCGEFGTASKLVVSLLFHLAQVSSCSFLSPFFHFLCC